MREELEGKGIALPVEPRAAAAFIPVVVEPVAPRTRRRRRLHAAVELEIDRVVVKIARGDDATLIGGVVEAPP